jgi:ATP:ADP antiporter, AAA family
VASAPLVDVRADERRVVAVAAGWFFCILASYYVLRPLREAMGIVGNVKDLTRLFLVTLAVTFALTPVIAAVVSRFPRRRFVPLVQRFFALNLVVFWLFLHHPGVSPNVARVFFVWTSVFNLFSLALFWSLMADLFRREQGARLFGVIGVGGTLGAMAGSAATAILAERIGISFLLLVAALLLEIGVWLVHWLLRLGPSREREVDEAIVEGGILRWLPGILRSPYLLSIVGYMLLFTFTSTGVYFEQARIVKAAITSNEARTALFAKMDLAVNLGSVVLQGLLVAPALRRFGAGITLVFLPLLTFTGFLLLRGSPTLPILVGFQVLRRACDYGIAKPSREVLFTVLPRQDKYKAKSFIDTFVYRAGDALGAIAESLGVLLPLATPLCLAWAIAAVGLGRIHRARGATLEG